ncbi:MAG: hypothetical protein HYS24_01510 [Ignavibacteriales bacterium]|nr:hypothetical protein [Ignavibacteriales bacterium]
MNVKDTYASKAALELIKNIVFENNETALNYFLSNRKVIAYSNKRILLPEFLKKLRDNNFYAIITISRNEQHLEEKLDLTYNRTLQKFSVLQKNQEKIEGPYCNNQYQELLNQILEYQKQKKEATQIDVELKIEELLKRMIIRHIKYSWLEVCRMSNRLYQRYRWELPTGTIELKKPQGIDGRDFTEWLNKNIKDPNPLQKNEKYRVQKEIDDWFGHYIEVDYSDVENYHNKDENIYSESEKYPENFTELIADEKSKTADQQRPAIRNLGKEKIKDLVVRILEDILYEKKRDIKIAQEFGITKATYSRFAGSDWKKNEGGEVPDLWKNIAKIIMQNPILTELTASLGIKAVVNRILEKST